MPVFEMNETAENFSPATNARRLALDQARSRTGHRHDHLFQLFPDGLALISVPDFCPVELNPALKRLLGEQAPEDGNDAALMECLEPLLDRFRNHASGQDPGDEVQQRGGCEPLEIEWADSSGASKTLSVRLIAEPSASALAAAHPNAHMPTQPVAQTVTPPQTHAMAWLVVSDISALHAETKRLTHDAEHDPLTGLPNRRLFARKLSEIYAATLAADRTGALMLIDLDRFKWINDTQGHHIGDDFLINLAGRLQSKLADGEFAARLGGDEFAVIVPCVGSPRAAKQRALDISAAMNLHGLSVASSASVGVSLFPNDAADAEGVLRHADAAMYASKRAGGGIVTFHRPMMTSKYADSDWLTGRHADASRSTILCDLGLAALRGELRMYYQPIVMLDSGKTVINEALLRWLQNGRDVKAPSEFMHLAENNGTADTLRRFSVETALGYHHKMRATGYGARIAINLSPAQIASDAALDWLLDQIAACEQPETVIFEITETTAFRDDDQFRRLHRLRDAGVHLAIDDFGVGHATLSYLTRIPAELLKLDKTFIAGIGDALYDRVVRAAVALGHGCGMKVIAEGVETAAQAHHLEQCGCDMAQGFYFGGPSAP